MKLKSIAPIVVMCMLFNALSAYSQDTAKILKHVKFPEMSAQLTITFSASDFDLNRKIELIDLNQIPALEKKLKGDESDAEIYEEINGIYSFFKKDKEAKEAFTKAKNFYMQQLSKAPNDTSVIRKMGDLFYGNGQMNMAMLYFGEIYKQDSLNVENLEKLSLCHFFMGSIDEANNFLTKALKIAPGDIGLYCTSTLIKLMTRIREISVLSDEEFEKIGYKEFFDYQYLKDAAKANPDDKRFELFVNGMQVTSVMYKSIFDIANQVSDSSIKVTFNQTDEIKKILNKNIKEISVFTNATNPVFPYKSMMIAEFLLGNMQKAEEYFQKAKAVNPLYEEIYNNMMAMYLMQEDYDHAIEVMEEINLRKPTSNSSLYISRLYYEKGNLELANEWAKKTMDMNSSLPQAFLASAVINLKENNFNEAFAIIYDLAKYLPNNPDVIYNLGICELLQGNNTMAKSYFGRLPEGNFYAKEIKELLSLD